MFTLNPPALFTFSIAIACTIHFLLRLRKQPTQSFPPGPKQLPILGNALQWPRNREWETFEKWGRQYGKKIITVSQTMFDMLFHKAHLYGLKLYNAKS